MHGIYRIKVQVAHNHEAVCEYTGKTHPSEGEYLNINGRRYVVLSVEHHVEAYPDSRGEHHLLDHVEISVAFRSKLN